MTTPIPDLSSLTREQLESLVITLADHASNLENRMKNAILWCADYGVVELLNQDVMKQNEDKVIPE